MTLPASGPISLNDVNIELAIPPLTTISLGDATVRALFNVDTGPISMSDGYGRSSVIEYLVTIEENLDTVYGTNLRDLALSSGWDGVEALRVVLESGYRITTTQDTLVAYSALTINGSFPNGVTFVNYGTVAGSGGRGGRGGYNYRAGGGKGGGAYYTVFASATTGLVGSKALTTLVPVTVFNYGTIAGGGGGGGGGGLASGYDPANSTVVTASSGGAGGGGGGPDNGFDARGGAGWPAESWTASGKTWTRPASPDGFDSSLQFGGAGRSGVIGAAPQLVGINGGNSGAGGDWGQSGSSGAFGTNTYSEYSPTAGALGGAAGAAVSGNAYITWGATGTRLGPIGD